VVVVIATIGFMGVFANTDRLKYPPSTSEKPAGRPPA
jgi:hypothetical protein